MNALGGNGVAMGYDQVFSALVRTLSPPLRRVIKTFSEGLVALAGLFMVIWGARLVGTTWHQSIAEFRSGSLTFRSRLAAPSRCSSQCAC
jgi:TRAP-type C4-dicarboxylate transport system permease small subunit